MNFILLIQIQLYIKLPKIKKKTVYSINSFSRVVIIRLSFYSIYTRFKAFETCVDPDQSSDLALHW